MNKFFSPDNIIMKFLTLFCDWMLLNLLFLLCSLPIFTIGASATALYSVIFKKLHREEPPISKTFFAEFKKNLKQATVFWVPYLLILVFLGVDVYVSHWVLAEQFRFLQYPCAILLFLILCATVFVFPQMALFDSPTKKIIKNSILLSIANFPIVFTVIIIHVLLFLVAMLSPKATFIVLSILIFFGFGALAYVFCIFYRRVFLKVLNASGKSDGEDEKEQEFSEEDSPI